MAAEVQCASAHCEKHALHVFILSPRRFFHLLRPLSILLLASALGFAHCSSDDNGGGGGGGTTDTPPTDTPPTDTGPPCDTELLSTTMTTGSCDFGGGLVYVGYGGFIGCSTPGSSLLETDFSHAGTNYAVASILSNDSPEDQVLFSVTPAGSTGRDLIPVGDRAGLVLQFNSNEFVISSASINAINNLHVWAGGLSWSSGEDVSVKLCVNE